MSVYLLLVRRRLGMQQKTDLGDARLCKTLGIIGLTADSRRVKPGYLFAALPKARSDSSISCSSDSYIKEAIVRGAAAILTSPGVQKRFPIGVTTFIEDTNPRLRFTKLAASFYGRQPKTIVAVTGTNGKTSVVAFVHQIKHQLGLATSSIGTLGIIGSEQMRVATDGLTTPDSAVLYQALADLCYHGVEHIALEASSHGLDQFRLDGIQLTAAAFTNLTRDHLDYHGSMKSYRDTKLRLFSELLPKNTTAVLNADDPVFSLFCRAASTSGAKILSYTGLSEGADYCLINTQQTESGQYVRLKLNGRYFEIHLPLIGSFQIANVLCALGLVVSSGISLDNAISALSALKNVAGRLQKVAMRDNGASIYVDYAHTPEALKTVLTTLRLRGCNRLLVVFGCGGNRDRGKRQQMGSIASLLADTVIITDDNPRNEPPEQIREEIRTGCPQAYDIANRALAIQDAVSSLQKGDVLLVAGKGHELGQIVGNNVLPHDDTIACQHAVTMVEREDL